MQTTHKSDVRKPIILYMLISERLSKYDTNIMKGVGILIIMLHNYFHIIPPISGQNEFSFSKNNLDNFLFFVGQNPTDSLRYIFSYLGHYGVPLFIFVSSYGLYLSCQEKNINFLNFLKKRILKIYPTLIIVVVLLLIFISAYETSLPDSEKIKSLLLKLTLIFNFIPGETLAVSGPLWFFALIVQLYALFPLLLLITKKYGGHSMLIIAFIFVLINIFLNPYLLNNELSTYSIFVGQIPVFCLGIYFASSPAIKIPSLIFAIAILIFALANNNLYAWHFSFLSVIILILGIFIFLKPKLKKFKSISTFIAYTGSISLSLFAVHGMVRIPFEAIAEKYNEPIITNFLAVGFLAGSFLLAWLVRVIEVRVQQFLNKKKLYA